ncbi:hypothetical protein [Streptomyces sp. NPDC000405]
MPTMTHQEWDAAALRLLGDPDVFAATSPRQQHQDWTHGVLAVP